MIRVLKVTLEVWLPVGNSQLDTVTLDQKDIVANKIVKEGLEYSKLCPVGYTVKGEWLEPDQDN